MDSSSGRRATCPKGAWKHTVSPSAGTTRESYVESTLNIRAAASLLLSSAHFTALSL